MSASVRDQRSLRALSPPECSLDDVGKSASKARRVGGRRIADRLHLRIRLAVVGRAFVRGLLARYQARSCIVRSTAALEGLLPLIQLLAPGRSIAELLMVRNNPRPTFVGSRQGLIGLLEAHRPAVAVPQW
jgi:hypothetical protein